MTSSKSVPIKRIIIISYRLPFNLVKEDGQEVIRQNSGGLVSAMSALSEQTEGESGADLFKKIVWAGKSNELVQSVSQPDKGISLKSILEKIGILPKRKERDTRLHQFGKGELYELLPIEIPPLIDEKYYGGFSNNCIWPLFHYFPNNVVYDESYFESYVAANKIFAEKIQPVLKPGDFIWVHDYQLFLLPALLRESNPAASIGFFLHIPFPTFEIFRIIPKHWRDAILNGILGSDLVGFHTNDYCQYFLRSVSRLLGHATTMNSVVADGRLVRVDTYPLGIDYAKFNTAAANSPEVDKERQKFLTSLQGRKLIFSVDRLDYTKGLIHRLEAFEYFLDTHPEWIEKVVFNMVVIPSRDSIPQYQYMKREIEALVGKINGKYSTIAWRPLIYQYKSLTFQELIALYDISHIGIITPIRDGMNLVAKEFIASQVTEKGVLILSEMAGAASELSEAILINPTNRQEVSDAIHKALTMSLRNRTVLLARMQRRIKNYTVFSWAKDILAGLEAVKKEQEIRKINLITPLIEMQIITRFADTSDRALFLDYDGTLVPFSKVPELALPDVKTIDQLKKLSSDPKNTIIVISGRDKNFLEECFGSLNIHLIAEHGAFLKSPRQDWICTIDQDQTWKSTFVPVFQRYTDRCIGSFIEEKFSSLTWHFRNASSESTLDKVKEFKEELRALAAHENKLQILEGDQVVELKKAGYTKGTAVLRFIGDHTYDYIFAIGDDRTDEDIFQVLSPEAVTIKIGLTTSTAKYNLANQREVSRIIDHLISKK